MKIMPLLLFFYLLVPGCTSRKEKSKNSRLSFENQTFEELSKSTESYNYYLVHEFNNKIADPASSERAKSIASVFFTIRDSSEYLCKVFDAMKHELRFAFKEDSIHYKDEFEPKLASDNIYYAIDRNTTLCLNLSTEINELFSKQIKIDPLRGIDERITRDEFYNIIFKGKNYHELLSGIELLKLRVKNFEKELLAFCNNTITRHEPFYTSYGVLIGQSSTILRPGEKLTISAGVGVYSTKAEARIKIGNDSVPVLNGNATKVMKISGRRGKHTIPVEIDFKDDAGEMHTKKHNVEYTIYK